MKVFFLMLILVMALFTIPSFATPTVKVGAEVLSDREYFDFSGKRIGLVTNHSAAIGGKKIVDLMVASGKVNLVAIFAPEHGYSGQKEDGVKIGGSIDELTGVPVYSLYGTATRPTPEMMQGIDILVFDIQDIGARFYTYISTMGLAMQSAAEMHIPFVILDRPNPLRGEYVSGPVLEKEQASFTGE